jgi:5'-nucleotidase
MTAAEIRSLVKRSWDKRKDIDLQVSGLSYLVRADGQGRVLDVKLSNPDGSPLAEDRTFKVGVSSYIAVSYQFDHRDPGRSLQTTPAEALIRFLESGPDLTVYRDVKRAFKEITGPSPRG